MSTKMAGTIHVLTRQTPMQDLMGPEVSLVTTATDDEGLPLAAVTTGTLEDAAQSIGLSSKSQHSNYLERYPDGWLFMWTIEAPAYSPDEVDRLHRLYDRSVTW